MEVKPTQVDKSTLIEVDLESRPHFKVVKHPLKDHGLSDVGSQTFAYIAD